MNVEFNVELPHSYFWEHPSWKVKDALVSSGVGGDWRITYERDRGITTCELLPDTGGFAVTDHVVRDADYRMTREMIGHYAHRVVDQAVRSNDPIAAINDRLSRKLESANALSELLNGDD